MALSDELRPAQTIDSFEREGWAPEPPKLNHALWLYYLYFRPRRFFQSFVVEHFPALTWVCALLLGFGAAASRLDTQLSRSSPVMKSVGDSWAVYFLIAIPIAALSAVLYMYLGAFWYAVRLRWSGVTTDDRPLVRRAYVYASTVAALPALLVIVWKTGVHATPTEAALAPLGWPDVIMMLAMCWSVVTSYCGVRTTFGVRGFAGALWFLILPMSLYVVATALGLLALFFQPPAPELTSPKDHADGAISFRYPSNWVVDTSSPDYDPDRYVVVSTPQQVDLSILVNEAGISVDEALDESIRHVQTASSGKSLRHADFGSLGRWSGRGVEFREKDGLYTYVTTVFVTTLPDGRALEFWHNYEIDDDIVLRPGFLLIADSLTVGTPAAAPSTSPDAADTSSATPGQ